MIVYSALVSAQENGVFVSPLDGPNGKNAETRLSEESTPIDASSPRWSEDSKSIAFVSAAKGSYDIGVWNIEPDDIRWLTKSDREDDDPAFSYDGRRLTYLVNVSGDIRLVIHDLQEQNGNIIEFKHGVVSSPRFSYDDKSVFFLFSGSRNPQYLLAGQDRQRKLCPTHKKPP